MSRYQTFLLVMLVILSSCTQDGQDSESQFDVSQDIEGNLLILNRLNGAVLLYTSESESPLKEIGAKEDFIVNIPSDGSTPTSLQIWKKSQVSDPLEPDIENIYKEWDIILSNTSTESEQVVWVIKSGSASPAVGQLSFYYPSTDFMGNMVIYDASIYLDSKNGKKITSLTPGIENKTVGLDFGYYYLFYKYSYEYTSQSEMVGWIELDSLGNSMNTLVNAGNPIQNIEVPIYSLSDIGRFGYLDIINQSPDDVKIFTQNDIQIEDVVVNNQSTYGLSIIENNGGSYNYLLPQNNYMLTAKNLITGEIVATRENVSVIELYNSSWTISDTISYRNITISNNLLEPLTIHNEENNDYLGFYIAPGENISYLIADSLTSLVARNITSTREAFQFGSDAIWNIYSLNPNFYLHITDSLNIDGMTFNNSEFTLSWELGSSANYLTYQLLNAEYSPYASINVSDSLFKSLTFEYLDDNKDEESYVFRLNSNSVDGVEYGWQEVAFQIDAIQPNGLYIYPRQQIITNNSEFDFDIMLEDIENVRSIYVELEYDKEVLSIDPDSIQIGTVFSDCEGSLLLINDNPDQFGILKINISFIGESCNGFEGSGNLVSVQGKPFQLPLNNESLLKINNNSSFRDINNSQINISNINASQPHISRVVFP
ncbi:MAG: hypothetical protein CMF99_06050 [Candidatus Marinimicrobia bacterium]|nr:hypothetical protein [Candidatus Neomarinimicrobiota bacterium]